jgi:hypothetical protein
MDIARSLAPAVDRLVISVYLTTRERHGLHVWDRAQAVGLDSIFLLNDVAEFLLEGRLTEEWAIRRFRYMDAADVMGGLDSLRSGGQIVLADDGYRAVPRLAGFLEWLLASRAEAAAHQWSSVTADVEELEGLLAPVLAGLDTEEFPLAASHRLLSDPEEPELRLHQHLTTLRFVRADAHGDAWSAAGLTAADAMALNALWKGGALPPNASADGLPAGGWATPDPWRITAAGVALRDQIEVETDRRNNTAYRLLDDAQSARLVELLQGLPGAAAAGAG